MATHRRFDPDELMIRPGTYFNPQTEVLIVVDDSPQVDHAIFDEEDLESEQWVLVSDESPLDENRRDELVEQFQSEHRSDERLLDDGDDLGDEEEELEPDEDPDELD